MRWGWFRRLNKRSPYPGNGPWSDLPPWERPGWKFGGRGRGFCWWWLYQQQQGKNEVQV